MIKAASRLDLSYLALVQGRTMIESPVTEIPLLSVSRTRAASRASKRAGSSGMLQAVGSIEPTLISVV